MPLQFGAALKALIQKHPHDWQAILDRPPTGPVSVLTPDLSTLTAFADVVFQVAEELFHIDFQSGPDPTLPARVLLYNAVLYHRYGLPVHSVVVLLRPRANRSDLTGTVRYEPRPGRVEMDFRFEVVRLWEVPIDALLNGGLGVLPLAPLGKLPEGVSLEEGLPGAISRMVERAKAEAPEPEAAELLTAAYVLSRLRLPPEQARSIFLKIPAMRDSSTYQLILDEGRLDEARKMLLRVGRKRCGAADAATLTSLQAITDLERLETLTERSLDVKTWQEKNCWQDPDAGTQDEGLSARSRRADSVPRTGDNVGVGLGLLRPLRGSRHRDIEEGGVG